MSKVKEDSNGKSITHYGGKSKTDKAHEKLITYNGKWYPRNAQMKNLVCSAVWLNEWFHHQFKRKRTAMAKALCITNTIVKAKQSTQKSFQFE